jgi:hypothetical protein
MIYLNWFKLTVTGDSVFKLDFESESWKFLTLIIGKSLAVN